MKEIKTLHNRELQQIMEEYKGVIDSHKQQQQQYHHQHESSTYNQTLQNLVLSLQVLLCGL